MQFTITTFLALAAAVAANTIEFVSQDSTSRTIYFTQNPGLANIPALVVPGNSQAIANFPTGWIGNFFSVSEGAPYKPGMLGEVNFDSFAGANYFDVSAIVDPTDTNGVQYLYPKVSMSPNSGCATFPCNNVYNIWNDVATKSTREHDLVCLLGKSTALPAGLVPTTARRHVRDFTSESVMAAASFPRSFIEGEEQ